MSLIELLQMNNITVYQCIPAYRPSPTVRIIQSLLDFNCKVLLDIEDSIQDVQQPKLNDELKAQARIAFACIVNKLPNCKFNIRINAIHSKAFPLDAELLLKFSNQIESVFIPKVESSNDLEIYCEAVQHNHRLNLIIETQKGVNNIDEILSSKYKNRIDFVFFGNYDFHLDCNIFPITEQDSFNYWEIVKPIITKVEKNKLHFGNSPYANIVDTNCLNFTLKQLNAFCKRDFAVMALHKNQSIYFNSLITEHQKSIQQAVNTNRSNVTIDLFNNNKQKGRSFAMYNDRIITPQEYLLLLKRKNG